MCRANKIRLKHRANRGMYFGICLAVSFFIIRCGKGDGDPLVLPLAKLAADVQFSYTYGWVQVGFSDTATFTITNEGKAPATEFTSNFNISSRVRE